MTTMRQEDTLLPGPIEHILPIAAMRGPRQNHTMSIPLQIALKALALALNFASAAAQPTPSPQADVVTIEYVVKANEIASSILLAHGIGTKKSSHRIYGATGYLAQMRKMNPGVDIDHLTAGNRLLLVVPKDVAESYAAAGGATPPSATTMVPEVKPTIPSNALVATILPKKNPSSPPRTEGGTFDCTQAPGNATVHPPPGAFVAIKREGYIVAAGDSISSVLYARGVGRPDGLARLFGKDGWIKRNKELNAGRADLDKMDVGQQIALVYPVQAPADPCAPSQAPDPQIAAQKARDEQAARDRQKAAVVVAAPEQATLSEIVNLRPEEKKQVDTQAIVKKLDDDTVAQLDDKTVDAIPEAAVEEKASETSIFDSDKPGMDKLFKNFKLTTPAAYLGARAGFSLAAREEALLSKVISFGLFAEVREGAAQGLRVIYETVPKITATSAGYHQSLEYNRFLLGWAFEFPAPFLFDLVHLTPRLGRYQIEAETPAGESASGEKLTNRLTVPSALGAGLEVDAEWAKYFYVLRLWGSREIVLPVIKNEFVSITTRAGIDVYLKGGSFTLLETKFSPNYLIFAAYEGIVLRGDSDATRGREVSLDLPTAGLGFTVTTN